MLKKFTVENKIWLWSGQGGWHFITIPPDVSEKIKKSYKGIRKGFGSIPVEVKIGKTKFTTSIFPYSKDKTYLLPIKKEVRKKEMLQAGEKVKLELVIKK